MQAPGGLPREHQSPVFTRLADFCNKEGLSDVTLIASCGRRLAGHRVVMAAGSDALGHLVTQEDGCDVHCPDVDGDTMELVLRFLYSSECPLTPTNATAVLMAAQKFGIGALEALATAFLADELNVENCCRLYAQWEDEGLQKLKAHCLALAADRWDAVHQTDGFLNLTLDQLKAMLKTPELMSCQEVDLLQGACSWILRDINRVKHLEELLTIVNFPRMSVEELQCVQQRLCLKYLQALGVQDAVCTSRVVADNKPDAKNDTEMVENKAQEPKGDSGDAVAPKEPKPMASAPKSQVGDMANALPLVLSIQPDQKVPASRQGSNELFPADMDEASQVRHLQELLLAQCARQPACAPQGKTPSVKVQQQGKETLAKDCASEDLASQNSENRTQQQDSSDMVSETGTQQINGAAGKDTKLIVQTPGVPFDVAVAQTSSPTAARTTRCVCQVEGCSNNLTGLRDYHVRYKICDLHLKVSSIVKDGRCQRFCQQCGRFHDLAEFDGNKRSCRSRLMRHNARRRKRLRTETEAFQGALQVARAALPAMSPHQPLICLVSAAPSPAGRASDQPTAGPLTGTLVQQADYINVLPQVSQALAFTARGAGTTLENILIEKLATPVARPVAEGSGGVGGGAATSGSMPARNGLNGSSFMEVECVKEEGMLADMQGVVH
ncbi:unnamed protein product [Ostreobium quekettii]|uniref:Uncharacterized protein n=1 Tax=Ostreobium quekettii TaxID=121088 RepID=A0A8S1IWJ2_9CHLO|nr:unnamed protein product [Ostreobium quekettii]